ncbi:hypothetical protein PTT_17872 [Pyrenophora teres f. teres 0-1]|uniref:Uncharacterized protein n=1 Tax=Pyrenophora teres f. teres (strain 0-1) TaxID=861557 RepID=E3S5G8_PYRTT|nr:hypothetical protein PTT_17872 [Pyrenophora teres f. teres 0-1]
MSCPTTRVYPLRKPPNHQPPIPRWKLSLPSHVDQDFISYIGIEQHDGSDAARQAKQQITRSIQDWKTLQQYGYMLLAQRNTPHARPLSTLNLRTLPTPIQPSIGLWHETLRTSTQRLETNYSGLDYVPTSPGLAKRPNTTTLAHDLSTVLGCGPRPHPGFGA